MLPIEARDTAEGNRGSPAWPRGGSNRQGLERGGALGGALSSTSNGYSELPPPRWPLSRRPLIPTMQASTAASRVWNFILAINIGSPSVLGWIFQCHQDGGFSSTSKSTPRCFMIRSCVRSAFDHRITLVDLGQFPAGQRTCLGPRRGYRRLRRTRQTNLTI